MELELVNCTKCHKPMVRSLFGLICRDCVLERTKPGTAEIEADGHDSEHVCRECGTAVDEQGPYCPRCQLRLIRRARIAVDELSEKLDRFPELRGSGRASFNGSRFYAKISAAAGPRSGRRVSGSRPFTPATKYSP